MGALHELLAVEQDLKTQTAAAISQTLDGFRKDEAFSGFRKTYTPFRDDGHKLPAEGKNQVATVPEKLGAVTSIWTRLIDVLFQKDVANGDAQSAIVVDGEILATAVPATTLLSLESKLIQLREVFAAAPSLDPMLNWSDNPQKADSYKTEEIVTYRTEKIVVPLVMAQATDKHPAQIQAIQKDEQVGEFRHVYYSGKISPKVKAEYLARLDKLISAVKTARARANQQETKSLTIGKALVNYISGPN